ncbi:MAG: TonB-dependent receptor [bacterium]
MNIHSRLNKRLRYITPVFFSIFSGGTPGTALAETPSANGYMEEVIVRAQRRSEDKQDVPVQITVLGSDDLRANDVLTMEDLNGKVPGAYFTGAGNYGGSSVTIRGIGGSATVFGEEPVAIFFDDQYLPRNGNSTQSLLDVESVEILRGPQATLYGRNATAGALLLRSTRPDVQQAQGYARVGAAEFGQRRYEVAYGTPLSDTVAVRGAALLNNRDGWADNISTGRSLDQFESQRARLSLQWAPSDTLSVFALVEAAKAESRVARARYAINSDNSIRISRAQIDAIEDGDIANNDPNFSDFSDRRAVVALTRQFDGFDLNIDAGYFYADSEGATDSDGTGDSLFANIGQFEIEVFTQNISLVSTSSGPLQWIVGASAVQDQFDMPYFFISNYLAVGGAGGDFRFFSELDTTAYAGFGEATYSFTDKFHLTAGLRGTYETKDVSVDTLFLILSSGGLLADPPVYKDDESWTAFKPRLIAAYDLREYINIFASISSGFKSGGYNAFGQVPAYDEEEILAYEIGAKGRFLDDRLELNAGLFYYDYEDLQLRLGVPTGGVAITNAGAADILGFEVEFVYQPIDGLTLSGSIALLDTEFKDFITRDLAGNLVDASGNELSRAPEEQFTLGMNYTRGISNHLNVGFSAFIAKRSDVFFRETNQDSRAWYGEPITEVDLRIELSSKDDRWRLAGYVQNITDNRTVVGVEAAGDFPIASFNEPRKAGMELTVNF